MICEEFLSQKDYIIPITMPLLGITKSAVDVGNQPPLQDHCREKLCSHLENDTVCHRDPTKDDLRAIQDLEFAAVISMFEDLYQVKLNVAPGLLQKTIDADQVQKFKIHVAKLSAWRLLALEMATSLCKSTVLAFMMCNGVITVDRAFELSRLEEDYQSLYYGKIDGFHDMEEGRIQQDLYTCKIFFDLSP
jgi:ATP synthase F1 complex assembly factor 2